MATDVFGQSRQDAKWLLRIHQGNWVPLPGGKVLYTSLNGVGAVLLAATALQMVRFCWDASAAGWTRSWGATSVRGLHAQVAPWALTFVAVTGASGALYRFLRNAVGMDKAVVGWLMTVHHGDYCASCSLAYVSLVFLLFATMVFTGMTMVPWVESVLHKLCGRRAEFVQLGGGSRREPALSMYFEGDNYDDYDY